MHIITILVQKNIRLTSRFAFGSFSSLKHISGPSLRCLHVSHSSSMPVKRVKPSPSDPETQTREDSKQPARRASSSRKRKDSHIEDEGSKCQPSSSKKAKVAEDKDPEGVSANGQPTNKVLPTNISFAPKNDGALRIATWNICGLAASSKKVASHASYQDVYAHFVNT